MIDFETYLCCSECRGDLKRMGNYYKCIKCCKKFSFIDGIFDCVGSMENEKLFSLNKWDEFYNNWFKKGNVSDEYIKVKAMYQTYGVDQIKKYFDVDKNTVFLELGCGVFIIGALMAKDCKLVIGIDFSMPALKAAKKILNINGVKNYLLIRGDIFQIPLKGKSVDLLYGGGVIEHFENTIECVREYGRVLKKRGMALNAVPLLNIGSLTYRQIWGNIPDFPILKQIAKWVHIGILKGKHMYFGYELSFTKRKLIQMHEKVGFSKVEVKRLDTKILFGFLPKLIRPILRKLANSSSLFWPMALVVAKK